MKVIIITLFLLCSTAHSFQSVIARLPKSGNTIRLLHSRLKQYFVLFKERARITNLQNDCLKLETYNPLINDYDSFLLCARSELKGPNELVEALELYKDNHLLQSMIFKQYGKNLAASSISELLNLSFRIKGERGSYEARGLTNIEFNFDKDDYSERFTLVYTPANFYLSMLYDKHSTAYERIKYEMRCTFCGPETWAEVREYRREGMPLDIYFYTRGQTSDVTPRLFDETLAGLFYGPLGMLGSTLQSSLVFEGGLPEIRF